MGSAPILDESTLGRLSDAEREIALDLVRGATVPEIAKRRGSSGVTVETQVKSIYGKLAVGSRVELAARLGVGAPARGWSSGTRIATRGSSRASRSKRSRAERARSGSS